MKMFPPRPPKTYKTQKTTPIPSYLEDSLAPSILHQKPSRSNILNNELLEIALAKDKIRFQSQKMDKVGQNLDDLIQSMEDRHRQYRQEYDSMSSIKVKPERKYENFYDSKIVENRLEHLEKKFEGLIEAFERQSSQSPPKNQSEFNKKSSEARDPSFIKLSQKEEMEKKAISEFHNKFISGDKEEIDNSTVKNNHHKYTKEIHSRRSAASKISLSSQNTQGTELYLFSEAKREITLKTIALQEMENDVKFLKEKIERQNLEIFNIEKENEKLKNKNLKGSKEYLKLQNKYLNIKKMIEKKVEKNFPGDKKRNASIDFSGFIDHDIDAKNLKHVNQVLKKSLVEKIENYEDQKSINHQLEKKLKNVKNNFNLMKIELEKNYEEKEKSIYEETEKQIRSMKKQLEDVEKENKNLQFEIDEENSRNMELSTKIRNLNVEVLRLKEKEGNLEIAEDDKKSLSEQINKLKTKMKESKMENMKLIDEIENLKIKNKNLSKVEKINQELEELNKEKDEKIERISKEVKNLKSLLERTEAELKSSIEEKGEIIKAKTKVEDLMEINKKELENKTSESEKKSELIGNQKGIIENLKNEIDSQKQVLKNKEEKSEDLEKRVREMEKNISLLNEEIKKRDEIIEIKEEEFRKIKETKQETPNNHTQNEENGDILQEKNAQINKLQDDLINSKQIALKYKKQKSELKYILKDLSDLLEERDKEIETLTKAIKEGKIPPEPASNNLNNIQNEEELNENRKRLELLQAELKSLKEENEILKKREEKIIVENSRRDSGLSIDKSSDKDLGKLIHKLQTELHQIKKEKSIFEINKKHEIMGLKNKVVELSCKIRDEEVLSTTRGEDKLKQKVEKMRKILIDKNTHISELQLNAKNLEAELTNLKMDYEIYKKQTEKLRFLHSEEELDIDKKLVERWRYALAYLREKNNSLQTKYEELQEEFKKVSQQKPIGEMSFGGQNNDEFEKLKIELDEARQDCANFQMKMMDQYELLNRLNERENLLTQLLVQNKINVPN